MNTKENLSQDLILDLNIPFIAYVIVFLLIILCVAVKYFFSSEEIFDFIEKEQKKFLPDNEKEKLSLLTKINTKINRDFLDNSKYYNENGIHKIFGEKNSNYNFECTDDNSRYSYINSKIVNNNDINNRTKIKISLKKKSKKVLINEDNIQYENEF